MYMNKDIIKRYALWAREMNTVRLTESIELSHFLLLTEILRRELFNEQPVNVKLYLKPHNIYRLFIK